MADAISLYVDISTPQGRLVKSLNDTGAFALGPFYQGQLLKLRVYPVIPTGSTVQQPFYSKVALDDLDLQIVIGPRAGSQAIKAAQYTWTKQTTVDSNGESGYFYADLDLNTTDMNNAVSTNDSITLYFEIILARGVATAAPVHQALITILAVVKDPGSAASVPTPTASYLTADQCRALFVMWNNALHPANNGKSIKILSPDGSHTRESGGVDNDGSPTDNLT